MLAAERRRAILLNLQSGGAVRVSDLAAELSVSEMTVRRDLDMLDSQDLLRRPSVAMVADAICLSASGRTAPVGWLSARPPRGP